MLSLSFQGKIAQRQYALWSCAIFLSQHLLILIAFKLLGQPLRFDLEFALVPLRSVLALTQMSSFILIVALAYLLAVTWALAVLAFRRAADANIPEWIAVFVIPPVVQIPAMIALGALPSRAAAEPTPAAEVAAPDSVWLAAVQGMLAGMALTLASVAVSALFFGAYGYGMFIASPFVVGATAGYLANRNGDIGLLRTEQVATAATALGGAALVVAALEGIVCIVMASPLVVAVALMGGMFGRDVAVSSRRSAHQSLLSVTLLPLVFAVDTLTSATTFDTTETILVAAPAPVVWNAIIRMDALDEPLALPFRLGVAYPLSGKIVGEGVGAIRFGEFSTGTAVERITEWVPDRKLAFAVIKDVPAMHELSPYSEVHAPHVRGYFTTLSTSFELIPLTDGRTEILEHTSHALRLDPIFYWLPFARWIVHQNNGRVLAHIRYQSERAARPDWR
ncbi:MAG: hypothetical protein J2P54_20075 [Bradyrhizobiaceae bacterium]|nr:hypothetical protein [Bradyrhizobiaceae bacterium]